MKKQYVKPTFQEIEIIMNDLCVGSTCTTIDLNTVPLMEKKSKTYVIRRGDSKDMWDSKF